jgi:hypothetical protein
MVRSVRRIGRENSHLPKETERPPVTREPGVNSRRFRHKSGGACNALAAASGSITGFALDRQCQIPDFAEIFVDYEPRTLTGSHAASRTRGGLIGRRPSRELPRNLNTAHMGPAKLVATSSSPAAGDSREPNGRNAEL